MSKQEGSGLTSSAGLMRYFEEEDQSTPKISPKSLMFFSIILGVIVLGLNLYYGLWP